MTTIEYSLMTLIIFSFIFSFLGIVTIIAAKIIVNDESQKNTLQHTNMKILLDPYNNKNKLEKVAMLMFLGASVLSSLIIKFTGND